MKVIVEQNKIALLQQATRELQNILEENKNKPVLFLTSGGSSFELLKNLDISFLNHLVTIGVLDERYSLDPAVNNFSQLKETDFFQRSEKLFEQILDTSTQKEESLEAFADRFDRFLKFWKEKNPEGIIVATMGMGSDGHTSGIMPHPENEIVFEGLFNDPRNWVVGYNAGDKNSYPERATTTLSFLRNIDFAVAYIIGGKKRDALVRVMTEEGSLAETPARILHKMKNVTIFTDIELGA